MRPPEHGDAERRLNESVRPPDWCNPDPKPLYDLVVIGGGTAGLVAAAGAAGLGARVALVERARLGGDCLNTGCVPSKALLRSARTVGEVRSGASLGITAEARVDFAAVMARMRARRADIAPHDSAARLRDLGVDVFFGQAAFSSDREIDVRARQPGDADAVTLRFRRAAIATGSSPAVPDTPGLSGVPFLTNETVWDLDRQPAHLIVLGAGPVGCELAQAFARLGTRVTLVERAGRVLPADDADAADVVAAALVRDGVDVRCGTAVQSISAGADDVDVVLAGERVTGDALLVAAGRVSNINGLGLDVAGVAVGADGIQVTDRLQTTNRRIYASGDVASRFRFTHAADALSRIVVQNALFFGRKRASLLVIPWCTFTDPELAHVGLSRAEAALRGGSSVTIPLHHVDRAVVDDETEGFIRVQHRRGRILGATIVSPAAGEMIGLLAFMLRAGMRLGDLASTIFPYPTRSLGLRQAGDAFRRGALTPRIRGMLEAYFTLARRLP
jgi:pyruvate/2-oxoglutarate dehydrogenase complex dihydrolipoamide dehydrogenase (E3) component